MDPFLDKLQARAGTESKKKVSKKKTKKTGKKTMPTPEAQKAAIEELVTPEDPLETEKPLSEEEQKKFEEERANRAKEIMFKVGSMFTLEDLETLPLPRLIEQLNIVYTSHSDDRERYGNKEINT